MGHVGAKGMVSNSCPHRGDRIMEEHINGLLSSPKTHIVNKVTNAINLFIEQLRILRRQYDDNKR